MAADGLILSSNNYYNAGALPDSFAFFAPDIMSNHSLVLTCVFLYIRSHIEIATAVLIFFLATFQIIHKWKLRVCGVFMMAFGGFSMYICMDGNSKILEFLMCLISITVIYAGLFNGLYFSMFQHHFHLAPLLIASVTSVQRVEHMTLSLDTSDGSASGPWYYGLEQEFVNSIILSSVVEFAIAIALCRQMQIK